MAIESVRASQPDDTEAISSFEVNFKLVRFAESIGGGSLSSLQGRLSDQASAVVDLGTSSPSDSISLLSNLA